MSEPTYPATPAPRPRPKVVTVASYLLYLAAATSVVAAVLSLTTVGTMRRVYADLYAGTADAGLETVIVVVSVVSVVINILFAAGLAILAIYDNRGRQGARIATWSVGGILLCCNGFGLLGTAATSGMDLGTGATSGPSASEVEAQLAAELPGWFGPVTTLLTVVTVVALLGAVILLALPAANAYFRKPQVAWDPMNPYPGYPGQPPAYPGQSPYPAYPGPGAGGQPPYPSYPGPGAGGQPPYPAYPGQPPAEQPPPGQPGPGQQGGQPPAGQQPSGVPQPPVRGGDPHTGSVPPTDPWSAPSPPVAPPPTPSSPPPAAEERPGRSPTDPA